MFAVHLRSLSGEACLNPSRMTSEKTFAELRGHVEVDTPFHDVKLFYGSQEIQDDTVVNIELNAVVTKSPDKAIEEMREILRNYGFSEEAKLFRAAEFLGNMEVLSVRHCDEILELFFGRMCMSLHRAMQGDSAAQLQILYGQENMTRSYGHVAQFVILFENLGKALAACIDTQSCAKKMARMLDYPCFSEDVMKITSAEMLARNGVESFPAEWIKKQLKRTDACIQGIHDPDSDTRPVDRYIRLIASFRLMRAIGNNKYLADVERVVADVEKFNGLDEFQAPLLQELRNTLQQFRSRQIIGDVASSESKPLAEGSDILPPTQTFNAQPGADVADETDPIMEFKKDLQEARVRSLADGPQPISFDDSIALFRQTCTNADTEKELRTSPTLGPARARVEEAGCSLFPRRANGAFFLIPLTDDQLGELGLRLDKFHILALRSDRKDIEEALRRVPRDHRPKLKNDHRAVAEDCAQVEEGEARQTGDSDIFEEISSMRPLSCEIKMLPPRVRELMLQNIAAPVPSEASVADSAPCGDEDSVQPVNPRRYA